MWRRWAQAVLFLLGAGLLLLAILPVTAMLAIPEQYQTAFISSKLLMLPVGALCMGAAAGLLARSRRR